MTGHCLSVSPVFGWRKAVLPCGIKQTPKDMGIQHSQLTDATVGQAFNFRAIKIYTCSPILGYLHHCSCRDSAAIHSIWTTHIATFRRSQSIPLQTQHIQRLNAWILLVNLGFNDICLLI
jgi:hypothetical protein